MSQVTTTIRVSTETHKRLTALATTLDAPISDIAAQAVKLLSDQVFWEQTSAAYAALRADPVASAAFDAELEGWDITLNDGLEGL